MNEKKEPRASLSVTALLGSRIETELFLPLFLSRIPAGFPSPADDYLEQNLDLNRHLIPRPSSTFFLRVAGDSMEKAGIFDGDILIVDRSIEAKSGQVVIAALDGDLTVKRLFFEKGKTFLVPENESYEPTEILGEMQFEVWGVVTYVVHQP